MPKLKQMRISVFVKCAALIALCAVTVASALTVYSYAQKRAQVYERTVDDALVAARNAADANGAAIRFGNTAAIEEFVSAAMEASEGRITSLIVQNASGEIIVAQGTEAQTLSALGRAAIEMAEVQTDATGFTVSQPALVSGAAAGAVTVAMSPAQALAAAWQRQLIGIAIAAAVLVGMVGLSSLILRSAVSRPLSSVNKVLEELSVGNYDVEVPGIELGDEVGSMARRVDDLRHKLADAQAADRVRAEEQKEQERVVQNLSEALSALAGGDLTHEIDAAFNGEYDSLRVNYNHTVKTLVEIIDAVLENSQSINDGAGEISSASNDLSTRTENQAAALEETAASLDEITTAIKEAAAGAQRVESIVSNARDAASKSDAVVGEAVDAMSTIEESSRQISQIISVIDDIAFQTNLLALNAGVEAARAGDAGRGFAVVASEVRALAQRSSDAAKEIKGLITQSTAQVEQGVELVGRTGEELRQIISNVNEISEHISGITASTADQSTTLSEVNSGVNQLDQVTQNNAAMVEEASAASASLREQAEALVERVSIFRLPDTEIRLAADG